MKKIILTSFILLFTLFSCNDINKTYTKKFSIYTFYKDLTIIENGKILPKDDVEMLKLFIDHKLLKDSIWWLNKHSYKELYKLAYENAKKGSPEAIMEASWNTNNSIYIKLTNYNCDNADYELKLLNKTKKNIKYFRALLKFKNNKGFQIGTVDLISKDTLVPTIPVEKTFNHKLIYEFENYKPEEIEMIPIIRRIIFTDSTELVNPLSSMFE
jgi:hypothetical protein